MQSEIINFIEKYNGGRPQNKLFDSESKREVTFKRVFSSNENDRENVFIFNDMLKNHLPLGLTDFGDVVCFNNENSKVYLYLHEQDTFEYICNNIQEFISSLY